MMEALVDTKYFIGGNSWRSNETIQFFLTNEVLSRFSRTFTEFPQNISKRLSKSLSTNEILENFLNFSKNISKRTLNKSKRKGKIMTIQN